MWKLAYNNSSYYTNPLKAGAHINCRLFKNADFPQGNTPPYIKISSLMSFNGNIVSCSENCTTRILFSVGKI
jgi:hypothetical protein